MFKIRRKMRILPTETAEQSVEEGQNMDGEQNIAEVEEGKKRNPLKRWQKIIIGVVGTIFTLALVATITVFILHEQGKNSIYNSPVIGGISGYVVSDNDVKDEDRVIIGSDKLDEIIEGKDEIEGSDDGDNTLDMIKDGATSDAGNPYADTTPQHTIVRGDETGETITSGAQDTTAATEADRELEEDEILVDGEIYKYNSDMISLLFLGVDKMTPVAPVTVYHEGGQSDAIYMLLLNPDTKIMNILAIPRDTIALIDIYYSNTGRYAGSSYDQICLQHAYGDGSSINNTRAAQSIARLLANPYTMASETEYTGIDELPVLPIHSVTSLNMGAVPALNDVIGGVTLNSLYTFDVNDSSFIAGKTYTLMGMSAYDYVHYRDTTRHYTAPERLERQKQYINLFVDKAIAKVKSNPTSIVDIYNTVSDYTVTDMNTSRMTYLATESVGYTFGQIYTLEGTIDTSGRYERFYADPDKMVDLILQLFYEKQ